MHSPWIRTEVHGAKAVPGSSYVWKKIEMCEGPYRRLVAWLESVDQNSAIVAQDGYDRWAADECSVLEGIAEYDLADIFLRLNG